MANPENPVPQKNLGPQQPAAPERGRVFSALPEGIMPFQGRGDAPAYEAYAMYVWSQIQKGEPYEPYGGRGDKGAIGAYSGYFVGEMQKRVPGEKPGEGK